MVVTLSNKANSNKDQISHECITMCWTWTPVSNILPKCFTMTRR